MSKINRKSGLEKAEPWEIDRYELWATGPKGLNHVLTGIESDRSQPHHRFFCSAVCGMKFSGFRIQTTTPYGLRHEQTKKRLPKCPGCVAVLKREAVAR